jgi:hypothetical protein
VTTLLAVPDLVAQDVGILEQRARALAAGSAMEDFGRVEERMVSFRIKGRQCAVEAQAVEKAVARLSRPLPVPLKDGGTRLVAFVDERPVPVVDLEGFASGKERDPITLESNPALLVGTSLGPVAVAVEGPLELLEDHLAFAAAGGDPASIRTVGMLAGGMVALDPAWLQEWAEKAARP